MGEQDRGKTRQGACPANTELQVTLGPRLIEFDERWRFVQAVVRHGAARDQAESDASADHAADRFETAYLDAYVEVAAEGCGGVHGEGMDRRSSVQHDERKIGYLGEMDVRSPGERVCGRRDEDKTIRAIRDQFDVCAFNAFGNYAQFDIAAHDSHHDFRAGMFLK